MDAFVAAHLSAADPVRARQLDELPQLHGEAYRDSAVHVLACADCERAWRLAERRLLGLRVVLLPVKAAGIWAMLRRQVEHAADWIEQLLVRLWPGRTGASIAGGGAGAAGGLAGKAAVICTGLLCAAGAGAGTAVIVVPQAVERHHEPMPAHRRGRVAPKLAPQIAAQPSKSSHSTQASETPPRPSPTRTHPSASTRNVPGPARSGSQHAPSARPASRNAARGRAARAHAARTAAAVRHEQGTQAGIATPQTMLTPEAQRTRNRTAWRQRRKPPNHRRRPNRTLRQRKPKTRQPNRPHRRPNRAPPRYTRPTNRPTPPSPACLENSGAEAAHKYRRNPGVRFGDAHHDADNCCRAARARAQRGRSRWQRERGGHADRGRVRRYGPERRLDPAG